MSWKRTTFHVTARRYRLIAPRRGYIKWEKGYISPFYKTMSPEDQRKYNRWLMGNAVIGSILEPIREVWIHGEVFAASRLSMMRIMARRMNAATVVA